MEIVNDLSLLHGKKINSLSLGNFDGLHIGHQEIIKKLNKIPPSLIITFSPHPVEVIKNKKLKYILTESEKIKTLTHLGVNYLHIVNFDLKFSKMKAKEFVEWVFKWITPKTIVIGYNHRFGYKGEGDYEVLVHLGKIYKFKVIRIPPVYVEGFPTSSSLIRSMIVKGNFSWVTKSLGSLYSLKAKVIKGEGRGKNLCYPTANLKIIGEKIIPQNGVYAVWVRVGLKRFAGMLHIGKKLTFNRTFSIEVHLINEEINLVNKIITVEFVKYIRKTCAFPSKKELKTQLDKDKVKVLSILKDET